MLSQVRQSGLDDPKRGQTTFQSQGWAPASRGGWGQLGEEEEGCQGTSEARCFCGHISSSIKWQGLGVTQWGLEAPGTLWLWAGERGEW